MTTDPLQQLATCLRSEAVPPVEVRAEVWSAISARQRSEQRFLAYGMAGSAVAAVITFFWAVELWMEWSDPLNQLMASTSSVLP
ncbi:MAG: hypothetical protein HJJLKODD_01639 [Phycisphaerae bacterium]|nr:hypothetical protein [Phycisphaerae bacterium]